MSQSDKITVCNRCYTKTWKNQRCFLLQFEGVDAVQHEEHVLACTGLHTCIQSPVSPMHKTSKDPKLKQKERKAVANVPYAWAFKGVLISAALLWHEQNSNVLPFLWLGFFFLLFVLSATRRDPDVRNPRTGNCTLQITPLPDIHQGAFYRLISLLSRYGLRGLLSCSKSGSHLRKGSKKI